MPDTNAVILQMTLIFLFSLHIASKCVAIDTIPCLSMKQALDILVSEHLPRFCVIDIFFNVLKTHHRFVQLMWHD